MNLLNEGVEESSIFVTGNTVIDALLHVTGKINSTNSEIAEKSETNLPFSLDEEKIVLITGHRRENFGDGFQRICEAISLLAEKYQNLKFVYPVHLNPRVPGACITSIKRLRKCISYRTITISSLR